MSTVAPENWKPFAAQLIRQIEPALAVPIYLLTAAEAGFNAPGDWYGLSGQLTDIKTRDHWKRLGLWRGRGFAAIVDAARIAAEYQASTIPPHDALRRIVGVVLHEFTHYVTDQPFDASEAEIDALAAASPRLQALLARPNTGDVVDSTTPPWKDHDGLRFGRAALHIAYRAAVAQPDFDWHPADVWQSGWLYRLSGPTVYGEALGNEPARRFDEPLRNILDTDPPADYLTFCDADLARRA